MAQLRSVRFNQVVLGEVRAVLIGPAPRTSGRFAFMDESGTTYGSTVVASFSARTNKILRQLQESMEADLVDMLDRGEVPEEPEKSSIEDEDDRGDGSGLSIGD